MVKKDFIALADFQISDLQEILNLALTLKKNPVNNSLKDKQIALVFQKNSTRTRVSFEVGINQLGANAIVLQASDMQLGRGESIHDTAKVMSSYVDAVMIRAKDHADVLEFAKYADVPVVNGLTDYNHPCQIMADILTFTEIKGDISKALVAWIGDGNNVCNSWLNAALKFGFKINLALKEGFYPEQKLLDELQEKKLVEIFSDPKLAAKDADLVTTDTFVSMGDDDAKKRLEIFEDFQVTDEVMSAAKKDAIFMHCLPAHRGEEVSASVIDGKQSVVFQEAENRLHVQKAILSYLLK